MQGHPSSMLLTCCGMSHVTTHQPHAVYLDQQQDSKQMAHVNYSEPCRRPELFVQLESTASDLQVRAAQCTLSAEFHDHFRVAPQHGVQAARSTDVNKPAGRVAHSVAS